MHVITVSAEVLAFPLEAPVSLKWSLFNIGSTHEAKKVDLVPAFLINMTGKHMESMLPWLYQGREVYECVDIVGDY